MDLRTRLIGWFLNQASAPKMMGGNSLFLAAEAPL
jgi:hypothetical protein